MLDLKRKFEISKPRDDDDDLTKKIRKIQTDMNQVYGHEPIKKRNGHLRKVPFLWVFYSPLKPISAEKAL